MRTIAVEEACIPKDVLAIWEDHPTVKFTPEWVRRLTDIPGQRLEEMDRDGIEMAILSLTVPGPQDTPDRARAEDMARRANDALAREVSSHPDRFAALACLSMHDTGAACREFERAVKELGMRGVLLNNIQIAGANRETVMFYDEPRFDEFWATAEKLDAPVYIHPGFIPAAGGRLLDYEGFEFLTDASWGYAVSTGLHALRIITSGVFDRHPRAQLVLGHLGEHIVLDMWRINNRIKRRPLNCVMKKELRSYFSTNVHVTTSGQFGNLALQHAIGEIGADRIMFAVDYPYEENAEGTSWFARAPISEKDRQAIGRDNAIRVFHLPLKP